MNTKKVLLVKYGEISLRKGNRAHFEHELLNAIRKNIHEVNRDGQIKVSREQGRFLIENKNGDIDEKIIMPRIRYIFGLTGFCQALKTDARDIADICKVGEVFFADYLKQQSGCVTFKIETKRSDKNYPITSTQVSAAIGEYILEMGHQLNVDLFSPHIVMWVEIRNFVYFYFNSENGEGGLPYGTSGKGVLLLSGGFDSPVAGYLTGRRGVELFPVYFHSPPFVSERAAEKVVDISRQLAKFTGRINLCIVPFTDIQLFLRDEVQPEKLTLFLKRAMLRISDKLAKRVNAGCLITGDSIGQVASQTTQSLTAMHSASEHTILRPLCAMDKQAIIDTAKKIETYDISVRPYDDCCTLFVAKHPENKPHTPAIEKIEARLIDRLEPLLQKAFDEAKYIDC